MLNNVIAILPISLAYFAGGLTFAFAIWTWVVLTDTTTQPGKHVKPSPKFEAEMDRIQFIAKHYTS